MWRDVDSLQLRNKQLSLKVKCNPIEANIQLENAPYLGQYIKALQLGAAQDYCIVKVESKGTIGCRIAGVILYNLRQRYGSIEQLPGKVYLQSNGGEFMERSLLTFYHLSTAERRQEIYKLYNPPDHTFVHIPAKKGSKAYEERVVEEVKSQLFPDYDSLDKRSLCRDLIKGRGKKPAPDGLLLNIDKKELVIIEAKKREFGFEEGTSQLIQYYAFAKRHPRFKDCTIKTYLVASTNEMNKDYEVWEELMKSTKTLNFCVRESDVRGL